MDETLDRLLSDTNDKPTEKLVLKDKLTKLDKQWLKNSYLIEMGDLDGDDGANALWSNAYLKYTDTSLGGNMAINTKYGFTPSADVPIAGRLAGREEYDSMSESMNFGMGRRYSEIYDDNDQILYLELGDPKFNSLISYLTNAIDYGTSVVANTGRSLAAYYAGKAIGGVVGVTIVFRAFPLWGAALFLAFAATKWLLSAGSDFTYYYMQSAMHKYWRMVNILVSQIGVELGLLTPEFLPTEATSNDLGLPIKITSEFKAELNGMMPGLITDAGYIDVFAVANKTQLLITQQKSIERAYYKSDNPKIFTYADKIVQKESTTFSSYVDELVKIFTNTDKIFDDTSPAKTDNNGAIEKLEKQQTSGDSGPSTAKPRKNSINLDGTVTISEKERTEKQNWFSEVLNYTSASARHGALYAAFAIEYTGSVTETFSNTVTDVPLKGVLNNVSSKARSMQFSLSNGNMFGDTLARAMEYGKDFVMGALESVTFGLSNIVAGLSGGGYFDIPKMWDDSSFEYQKHSFKIRLGGPYGHPISQLQDIYMPLMMLIAATAAQSAGKAGYTTPLLCSPFIKGILNTPLALIDSLVIERGVGNMGFDLRGRPLAVDVTFSIIDLTSFITAPVDGGIFTNIMTSLDDSSPMSRYIQLLAGRDLYTTKYWFPKQVLKYNKLRQSISMLNDPSSIGTMMGHTIAGSVVGALIQGFTLPRSQLN